MGAKGVVTASRIHQQAVALIQDRQGISGIEGNRTHPRCQLGHRRIGLPDLGVGESVHLALISEPPEPVVQKHRQVGGGQATVVGAHQQQLPPARDVLPAAGLNVEVMAVEPLPDRHQFPDQLGIAQRSRVSIKRSRITIKGGVGHQQEESRARAPRGTPGRLAPRTLRWPPSQGVAFCQQHFQL